jgi:hypothetical protein
VRVTTAPVDLLTALAVMGMSAPIISVVTTRPASGLSLTYVHGCRVAAQLCSMLHSSAYKKPVPHSV